MNPQKVFDDVFMIEGDMAGLAASAVHMAPEHRADSLSRLAVASEGVRQLFGTLLQFGPAELPFRDDFVAVHELMCSRERALQELVLRGDHSVAQMMNVASLVDLTAGPLRDLLMRLGWLQAVACMHAFLHWLTKETLPGAGFAPFDASKLQQGCRRCGKAPAVFGAANGLCENCAKVVREQINKAREVAREEDEGDGD